MPAPRSRNRILSELTQSDFDVLAPHLVSETLEGRHAVETPNKPITHVYFPETCIISVVAKAAGDLHIEAGLIGREGMTGLAVVMATDRSPHEAYVQVPGATQRAPAEFISQLMRDSVEARQLFLRFANVFMVQTAQTALANGRARIEERLARWLLMAHDRMGQDEILLTHEFISVMLGVRRPGVTDALHQLEGRGMVRAQRGQVHIVESAAQRKTSGERSRP